MISDRCQQNRSIDQGLCNISYVRPRMSDQKTGVQYYITFRRENLDLLYKFPSFLGQKRSFNSFHGKFYEIHGVFKVSFVGQTLNIKGTHKWKICNHSEMFLKIIFSRMGFKLMHRLDG